MAVIDFHHHRQGAMSPFKIFSFFGHSQLFSAEIDQKAREYVLATPTAAIRCVLAIILGSGLLAHAVDSVTRQETDVSAIENPGAAIEVDGRPMLFVYAAVGGYSPQERAEHIQQRIVDVAKRTDIPIELIRANERGSWTEILAGNDLVMGVTESDAKAIGRERSRLTAEYVEIIRQVIRQYRAEHTWRELLRGVVSTLVATVALASSLLVLFGVRSFGRASIGKRLARHETEAAVQSVGHRLMRYGGRQLLTISRIAFWIAVVALLQTYGTVVLRFFPATRTPRIKSPTGCSLNWEHSEKALLLICPTWCW